jgi:hypothetical protein
MALETTHILPFLDFPYEIRDMIYRFIIPPQADWIPMDWHGKNCTFGLKPEGIALGMSSLLLLCRQIHNETIPILYGREFVIPDGGCCAVTFLQRIGPRNLAYIEKLKLVVGDSNEATAAVEMLQVLSTRRPLQCLTIELIDFEIRYAEFETLKGMIKASSFWETLGNFDSVDTINLYNWASGKVDRRGLTVILNSSKQSWEHKMYVLTRSNITFTR